MTVTVNVTEDDIRNGFQWSYIRIAQNKKLNDRQKEKQQMDRLRHCPVAIALNRTFGCQCVAETYRLNINGVPHRTPEIVSDWMDEFDRGNEVKPLSFDLEV